MIDLRPMYWILVTGNVIEQPATGYDNRIWTLVGLKQFLRDQVARAVRLGFTRIVLPMWQGQRQGMDSWSASVWRCLQGYVRQLIRSGFVKAIAAEFGVTFAHYHGGFMDPKDPDGNTNNVDEADKVRVDPAIEAHAAYLEGSLLPLRHYVGSAFKELFVDQSVQDPALFDRLAPFLRGLGFANVGMECHVVKFNNPQDAAQGGSLVNVPFTTVSTQTIMAWDTLKDWRADRAVADRHIRIHDPATPVTVMRDWAGRGFIIDASSVLGDDSFVSVVRAMQAVRLAA